MSNEIHLPPELEITDRFKVGLPNLGTVYLPLCSPVFKIWDGIPVNFDYGNKPMLNYKGESCFAELAILRTLLDYGWDGVWVEAFGGTHFLRSMPKGWGLKSEHVPIPKDKEDFLKEIQKSAGTKACFDVFVWKKDQILFLEGKHKHKDQLTEAQLKFIEGALKCGMSPRSLIIIEWKTDKDMTP